MKKQATTTPLNETCLTIDKPIVGAAIRFPREDTTDTENMRDNWTNRPRVLAGMTYRSQHPDRRYRVYVTINHNYDHLTQQWRPYEIFISPSDASAYQWLSYSSRRDTRMLRNRDDIVALITEMKETFDTCASGYLSQGKYIPSVIAEIGFILEEHVECLKQSNDQHKLLFAMTDEHGPDNDGAITHQDKPCSKCQSVRWIRQDNCDICGVCGDSKCGD